METCYVAFDTEFTGLRKDTSLISIGFATEIVGKKYCLYLELTDYKRGQVNIWIRDNVLNNLILNDKSMDTPWVPEENITFVRTDSLMAKKYITDYFMTLINEGCDKIQLVSYVCHYDMMLLIDIFGDAFSLPSYVYPCCVDINDFIYHSSEGKLTPGEAFDVNREEYIEKISNIEDNGFVPIECPEILKNKKHNALWDAIVIYNIFSYIG